MSLVDAIEELETEQAVLDELLDTSEDLAARIQAVIDSNDKLSPDDEYRGVTRRLARLQRSLAPIDDALKTLEGGEHPDVPRMKLYRDHKQELTNIDVKLFSLDIVETDDFMTQHTRLSDTLFNHSVRLFETHTPMRVVTTTDGDIRGARLPRLEVPTFDGNMLHWRNFWEQFSISVHSRSGLSPAEKLVYLQQALKDGPARSTIEGLSRSGDNYKEAVRYLKTKYDRPRLHQAHVKTILDAPPIKEEEIRKLHDTVIQNLRALKSMGYDPSGPLELKLDPNTMFEWQTHSQKSPPFPRAP
ncbi:uncharacterized protein LOC135343413 [Halichondria panicea]|uniref:uncharacterized protein LOC135343413 n=1 Tax=Halichondria panicea TaxID=6063 RepID=UPI00312BA1ED